MRVDIESAIGKLTIENRADRLIDQRPCGRIPNPVYRRVTPKFQQDEIGFQRRVGGEVGPPVPVAPP